jgi:hypothetical protein
MKSTFPWPYERIPGRPYCDRCGHPLGLPGSPCQQCKLDDAIRKDLRDFRLLLIGCGAFALFGAWGSGLLGRLAAAIGF